MHYDRYNIILVCNHTYFVIKMYIYILKVKLDNDNTKTFRLIKPCDLQLYEGVSLSSNSESQTEEQSFEY